MKKLVTGLGLLAVLALLLALFPLVSSGSAPAGVGSPTSTAVSAPQSSVAPLDPAFLRSLVAPPIGVPSGTARGYRFGETPGPLDFSYTRGMQVSGARGRGTPPATYDLRTLSKVTSVKDQSSYGACWAFASLGSLESCLLPVETWDFSEDNMLLTSGFDNGGDPYNKGGQFLKATAYLARWGGPVNESEDAYADSYTPAGLTPSKHLQEIDWIPIRGSALDNDNVKNAVMQYGGVYVAMSWPGSPTTSDSYYNATTASYYYSGVAANDHAVLIVGWDDNYPAANFATTPPGAGAFIAKNSWGAAWGSSGYFYVSYYDSKFGRVSPMAVFNKAESTSNYIGLYDYDPLGNTSDYRVDLSSTGWFANVFTAQATASLSAVGFYTEAPGSSYEVYTGSSLATTTLRTSGTLAYMGYHTVTLPSLVTITGGQQFVVAVKMTSPGYGYPIAIEKPIAGYSTAATATAGQSYVSSTGSNWMDLTTKYATANTNVCLKAYVTTYVPQPPAITGFTPTSGPAGTSVTVTGTDFTGATTVTFNGAAATFSVATAEQLTATVPVGAASGPIAVTTPVGTGSSASPFLVTIPVFTPTVALKLNGLRSGAIRLGKRVTAKGKVTPTSLAGSKVTLTVQKKSGRRWATVKSTARTIGATGSYSWQYKPAKRGAYHIRTTITATAAHAAAKTPWRSFRVK